MLSSIRKSSKNIFVRIILFLVALSFFSFGGMQFWNNNSSEDLVYFSKAPSISADEFYKSRAKEIENLQSQSKINITPEIANDLGINSIVLRRLINTYMINYIAGQYDYDISDDFIIKYIKKIPYFQGQNGNFDAAKFRSYFNNSPVGEKRFLNSTRQDLIVHTILDVFHDSFKAPDIMVDNLSEYLAQTRVVDLFEMKLNGKPSKYIKPDFSNSDFESFYQKNQNMFIVPESRSFSYLKSDKQFLKKKLIVSEGELKQYFEENKNDFAGKDYQSVKKEVREAYSQERLDNLMFELAKNLESDVSNGLNLEEISKKYELPIYSVKSISAVEMNSSKEFEYAQISDLVFEMSEGEISYPVEIHDHNELMIVHLNSIKHSRQKQLNEVKEDIKNELIKRSISLQNIQIFEDVRKNYVATDKSNVQKLKSKNISLLLNKSFIREDLRDENKLPAKLLDSIFLLRNNESTKIVVDGQKAYFAYLKNIKLNKARMNKIREKSHNRFSVIIQDGIFDELINYSTKKNDMKIDNSKIGL